MNALLAFPIFIRRQDPAMYGGNTEAMDWFVIATLCFFFFLLGCFATAAWQIWRRATRPEPHVKLLMELADSDEERIIQSADEKTAAAHSLPPSWEKPPDWWKH